MLTTDIKIFKAANITDTPANGGRSSAIEYAANGAGIFPDIMPDERNAGATRFRKIFIKNCNNAGEVLANPKLFMKAPSPSGDIVTFARATATDTKGTTAPTRSFGACDVATGTLTAGATSLTATLERADIIPFQTGDTIVIMLMDAAALALDATNLVISQYEYHNNVTVAVVGTTLTLTLETGDQILRDYSGKLTVASVCQHTKDLKPEITNTNLTSAQGVVSTLGTNLFGDNSGSITDTVTINWTSSSAFTGTSLVKGALGAGNISTDFAPINADFGRPMFTLKASAFSGLFATGDSFSFDVVAADFPVFLKEVIPAGSPSYPRNKVHYAIAGETL